MLEKIFTTSKYDNKIAVTDGIKNYTVADLKNFITSEIKFLKSKKENVVILAGNNFDFIIQFFASIFANKNIYLITDKTRLKNMEFEYDLLEEYIKEKNTDFNFKYIDITQPKINFYTSGS